MKQAGPTMTKQLEATLYQLAGRPSNLEDTDNLLTSGTSHRIHVVLIAAAWLSHLRPGRYRERDVSMSAVLLRSGFTVRCRLPGWWSLCWWWCPVSC
jgi:hypothetical protein